MFDDAIELLFTSERAERVTHYPPTGDSADLTGLFEELDLAETEQQEGRGGLQRNRSAKLILPAGITVSLGKHPSIFKIREAVWQASAVISGRGLQTVRLTRHEQATQARPMAQGHQ